MAATARELFELAITVSEENKTAIQEFINEGDFTTKDLSRIMNRSPRDGFSQGNASNELGRYLVDAKPDPYDDEFIHGTRTLSEHITARQPDGTHRIALGGREADIERKEDFVDQYGDPTGEKKSRKNWSNVDSSWISRIAHDDENGFTFIDVDRKTYAYNDARGFGFEGLAQAALRGGSVGRAWWQEFGDDDGRDNFYYMGKAGN